MLALAGKLRLMSMNEESIYRCFKAPKIWFSGPAIKILMVKLAVKAATTVLDTMLPAIFTSAAFSTEICRGSLLADRTDSGWSKLPL